MDLIFDTETTGFPRDLPDDHENQPHCVQLAAMLIDEAGVVHGSMNLIIDTGLPIPDSVAKIHGITTKRAYAVGVLPREALTAFGLLYRRATTLVAHNVKFDIAILRIAITREYGAKAATRMTAKPQFCTADAATPLLNLPPTEKMIAAGRGHAKTPNLTECMHHMFGEKLEGAHDAMVDVRACARVYQHIRQVERDRAAA